VTAALDEFGPHFDEDGRFLGFQNLMNHRTCGGRAWCGCNSWCSPHAGCMCCSEVAYEWCMAEARWWAKFGRSRSAFTRDQRPFPWEAQQ
jgi:hypothetical protein